MSMLEDALAYAARGWRVIPIHTTITGRCSCGKACGKNAGKHPHIKKDRERGWGSIDLATITRWWSRWPDANIGIATGSGVVVLDIDNEAGTAELQRLTAEHGPLTPTAVVRTGRRDATGFHIYLAGHLDGSHLPEAILFRGEGSFVVGPPSLHQSGQRYEWINDLPLAPLPDWLKNYAEVSANKKKTASFADDLPPRPAFLDTFQQLPFKISTIAATNIQRLWSPLDQAEIESALSVLDPNCKRKPWLDIGMALHSLGWERSDGTSIGYDLWDRWSSGAKDKYSQWDTETRWRSFRGGGNITIGTLFHYAQKAGWIRSRQAVAVTDPPAEVLPAHAPGTNGHASAFAVLPPALAAPARPIRWSDRNEDGDPKITCANAQDAIQHLGVTCAKDVFHEKLIVGGHPIAQWAGDLSDDAVQMLRHIVRQVYGLDFGERHVRDAAIQLCLRHQFNPVTDYLASLRWDGVPRIANLLPRYFGADETAFTGEVGRLMLTAAVRRARAPGCKFDQIVVLEGPEGTGKSMAIKILAGENNFSDQRILGASDKEQQEAVTGVWLYELAELEGIRRTDVERIKQFASRTEDRARPAYGRFRIDRKRTCVFIATTNEQDYLKGTTGNRRFWPVKTSGIDLEGLERDRDQLWAEAAAGEAAHASIGLDARLWATAGAEQHERLEDDAWLAFVEAYVAGKADTSVTEVLSNSKILMHPREINQVAQSRAARCLAKLKWERYRQRHGSRLEWRYRPSGNTGN